MWRVVCLIVCIALLLILLAIFCIMGGARSANPNTPTLIADLHLPISRGGMDPNQLPMTAAYGVMVVKGLGGGGPAMDRGQF
jgi:hypothetical protein